MYSTEHILYIVFSLLIISLILFGAHFIKKQKYKDLFLLFWAFACFFFHISTMYTSFFNNGGVGNAYDNQLFPIYFCNYMMYLLLIASLWPNKNTRFFKIFATFLAWGGTFGALITLFITPPGFGNWSKSSISIFAFLPFGWKLMAVCWRLCQNQCFQCCAIHFRASQLRRCWRGC